jgi:hypothetical protein
MVRPARILTHLNRFSSSHELSNHRPGSRSLPFTQAVTQSIRRDDEEDFERSVSVLVDAEVRFFLFQPIRLQFSERRLGTVDFKEASFLSRVASVFC